jgi:hypothetical protein
MLRVPRAEENEGLLLLGDPGTGKSQVIHPLREQIAQRRSPEVVVCYDPLSIGLPAFLSSCLTRALEYC